MKVLALVLLAAVAAQAKVVPKWVDPIIFYPEALKNLGLADTLIPEAYGEWDGKIVGGTEVTPHSVPWQCALLIGLGGGSFCGCSIISNNWVLTAAHCADGAVQQFEIILGAHNWRNTAEAGQERRTARSSIVHESWNTNTLANDIAVIPVSPVITFNNNIRSIRFQPSTNPATHAGEILTVTGWGLTQDGGSVSNTLNTVDVVGITTAECRQNYTIATDRILCTSTWGGHGTCNGDSGGPLTTRDTSLQVGIVSFGSSQGCQKNYPVGFTRISSYATWITDKTGVSPGL